MEKSRKELIDKLLKELGELAPNEQKAIVFIINNFSIIKKMCENSGRQYNQVTMYPDCIVYDSRKNEKKN